MLTAIPFKRLLILGQKNSVKVNLQMSMKRAAVQKDAPEEATPPEDVPLQEPSETFHIIENTKSKMLLADPNLERKERDNLPRPRKDALSVS